MERKVNDKIVVITGGVQGLGLSIARKFLEYGAKIVILLDIDTDEGKSAVIELNKKHGEGKAVFIECDVTKNLEKVSSDIINDYKTVDILVNNAGWVREDCIRATLDLNTIAVIEWSMKFYEHMRTDNGGCGGTILNMSSAYGFRSEPYTPFYTASKFAVLGFSRSLGHASKYSKTGVRVCAICPGFTRGTLLGQRGHVAADEVFEEYMKMVIWQEPDNVGEAAVEIYKRADSGTAWLTENGNPIEQV